jgi:hypothetical protein
MVSVLVLPAFADAEVDQNDFGAFDAVAVARAQQNIVWLQVSVDVALVVQVFESVQELHPDLHSRLYAETFVLGAAEHGLQTGSILLHDDVLQVVLGVAVADHDRNAGDLVVL